MSVELSECVPKLPARLLLRQDHHALEVDRQSEAEHGLDKDADCLEQVDPYLLGGWSSISQNDGMIGSALRLSGGMEHPLRAENGPVSSG